MTNDPDMTIDAEEARWTRTKAILGEALEKDEPLRVAFVEAECADDAALLSEIKGLLDASREETRVLADHSLPAAALADAMRESSVAAGTMIGRYTVGAPLGRGGMGAVFEATDSTLGRRVALKLLSTGVASMGARRRFESEATILARLDHPGIARVFEAGVHQTVEQAVSVPYFAMEFVDGARTLDAFVRDTSLSLPDLLSLFAGICDAIHHGHQKGVLHRDIKPANILINAKGECKVIDFGVSRLLEHKGPGHATLAGDLVGTPAYLPPEAFDPGKNAVDIRADVYALGVVFYESLVGKCPFPSSGHSPLQVGRIVCSTHPPLVGVVRHDCRGEVETIIAKAMAADPADRYQSVAELGADLRRVLSLEPILAKRTPRLRLVILFARRNRSLVAAGAATLLALAVGVIGLAAGLARARESEQRARQEATRSRQISTFVMQMLRAASPFQGANFRDAISMDALLDEGTPAWPSAATPGRAPTVGDLLSTAADHVKTSFPDGPEQQADMAAVLAQTAYAVGDPRASQLAERAESLLAAAYGKDDRRTLTARQHLYSSRLVNADTTTLSDMERDLVVLRERNDREERPLLRRAWSNVLECLEQREDASRMLPTLREIRESLDGESTDDQIHRLMLDLAIERITSRKTSPAEGLKRLDAMLSRARAIPDPAEETVLAVLFEMHQYQRELGDPRAALATLAEGASISARHYGGMDPTTYEWWSSICLIAMQTGEFGTAEHAARQQTAGAEAMLGPHSLYTSKAYGRLARALLAQQKNPPEAEAAARKAIDSAPEMLASGDGWAIYYEVLWAWSIRLQGDPTRAASIIRNRVAVETGAGRPRAVDWVEIVRAAELAQCEMDLSSTSAELARRTPAIEALLKGGEACGIRLGIDWPSVRLVEAARLRFTAMQAETAQVR